MKEINLNKCLAILLMIFLITGCDDTVTDFGFDGGISGKMLDQSGNIVAGDITSGSFILRVLGESDNVPMVIRVKGDGTFNNTHLYPQKYTVWTEGPVLEAGEEVALDLSEGKVVNHNFTVTPLITIPVPELSGNASASEITVNYSMIGNDGNEPGVREIYCSTVPYPNASTGNGAFYHTKNVSLGDDQGTVTVSGLESGTKYYIRIGARASGANAMNFSDQLIVTTP